MVGGILQGELRPVRGVLAAVEALREHVDLVLVASENALDGVHVLDGDVVELGGVRVGGVGGVIGNSAKNQRREERVFLRELRAVLDARADVVVLHQGPDADGDLRGHEGIRDALDDHAHKTGRGARGVRPLPLAPAAGAVGGRTQVINADGRVLVLVRAGAAPPAA